MRQSIFRLYVIFWSLVVVFAYVAKSFRPQWVNPQGRSKIAGLSNIRTIHAASSVSLTSTKQGKDGRKPHPSGLGPNSFNKQKTAPAKYGKHSAASYGVEKGGKREGSRGSEASEAVKAAFQRLDQKECDVPPEAYVEAFELCLAEDRSFEALMVMRKMVRGNIPRNLDMYYRLAKLCSSQEKWDLMLDVYQQLDNKEEVNLFCTLLKKEIINPI